jgi:HAD superfamily hydrolase (TIGR01549 family)
VTKQKGVVIFDVDGVLLDLTTAEEDVFFAAFADWCAPSALSRDWNSYKIRNDDNIVDEIMDAHDIAPGHKARIVERYHVQLESLLTQHKLHSPAIPGASVMLRHLKSKARLGIATANFLQAARLRLQAAQLWEPVSGLAQGADGGGHKHEILARALRRIAKSETHVIYVGDNVNDVEAGQRNGVEFIGFSSNTARLKVLGSAGARNLSSNHTDTTNLIESLLTR